jgi:hypothetical protein
MNLHLLFSITHGWIPGIFGLGCAIGSVLVSWRTKRSAQYCLSLAVFACVYWSLYRLYCIFYINENLQTFNYYPHLVIATAFSISVGQAIYVFGRETKPA